MLMLIVWMILGIVETIGLGICMYLDSKRHDITLGEVMFIVINLFVWPFLPFAAVCAVCNDVVLFEKRTLKEGVE